MRSPCLLAALLFQIFAGPSPSVPLPFHLTPRGAILVPVVVNGRVPAVFILDTGSNGSAVSDELTSSIGAKAVAKRTMTTAAGENEALVARLDSLGLSGVTASGVMATIVPSAAFALPEFDSVHVQGVIGQDVLAALRYTIDYRKRRIVWYDTAAQVPRTAAAFELEPHDSRFLVLLPQDRGTLRLVPDSGADELVLFQTPDCIEPSVALGSGSVDLTALAGTRTARSAVVRTLRIGSRTLKDVAAVIVNREEGAQAADGLLPLHIFGRVTFNGPDRQLLIEK